jgi:hypothetical protein
MTYTVWTASLNNLIINKYTVVKLKLLLWLIKHRVIMKACNGSMIQTSLTSELDGSEC